jgi:hypothetical protein
VIPFASFRQGDRDVYTIAPDGSNLRQVTFSQGEDRARAGRQTVRGSPSRRTATAVRSTSTASRQTERRPRGWRERLRMSSIPPGRRPGRRSHTRSKAAASGRSG